MKQNVEYMGGGIQCDNPECDYLDLNVSVTDYHNWLNKPCPKCGENLLTQEDYDKVQAMLAIVNLVNQMDIPDDGEDIGVTMEVDVHNNKMTIIDIESPYDQKKIDEKLKGRKSDTSSDK
jgi:hypothetical protein